MCNRRERLTGTILVCATAAVLVAAGAAARSTRVIPLQLHGTVVLAGSKIRCGSGQLKGLTYVDCGVADGSGQPKRGSYVALMAADGRVNIVSATTLKTEFSRVPAAAVATPSPTVVRPGDTVTVPGTALSCSASRVSGKATIICYYLDAKGVVRPHSYSFGISDSVVTALGWDGARHAHLIHAWPENG